MSDHPRSPHRGDRSASKRSGGARPETRRGSAIDPHRRHRMILVAIAVFALILGGRLLWVQGLNSEALAEKAVQNRTISRTVPANRGDILDANGRVLATNVERYDIWVNQNFVADYLAKDKDAEEKGIPAAAKQLAPLTGLSVEELEKKLTGTRGFEYIVKGVEPERRAAIMNLGIPGIGSDPVFDRIYPAGDVGGNVIGFVGADGTALAGTELSWDTTLRGKDGHTTYERGAGGQAIPSGQSSTTPAVDGDDVILTIDQDIQHRAQQIIASTVKDFGAKGGSIVVIDVKNGDIVALADYPTYNPNDPGATPPEYRGNQSVSNVFEPGSTGKLFTVAAAIEEGTATPASRYTVPYKQSFKGHEVRDSHPHEVQQLTLPGVLKNSSNTGTVQIATTMSPQTRHDYLVKFGLGSKTGVPLPGESAGILHDPEGWNGRTEFATAFGQGYSVTALQITSAVGTFANDGVHVTPRIIKGVRDANGTVHPVEKSSAQRVVSPETAHTMLQLMDSDIPDDGKQNANVPHFAVGGKTGTAQVPGGTYTASFIGMAPMDDPHYVVGVFVFGLDSFQPGNTVAAPAFSEIMGYTLHVRRVAPTGKPGVELENEWK